MKKYVRGWLVLWGLIGLCSCSMDSRDVSAERNAASIQVNDVLGEQEESNLFDASNLELDSIDFDSGNVIKSEENRSPASSEFPEVSIPMLIKTSEDRSMGESDLQLVTNPTREEAAFLADEVRKYVENNGFVREWVVGPDGREIERIAVSGRPPATFRMSPAAVPDESAATLVNVPAFNWCYGCSATSAAMMAGYFDRHGYPDMYTGTANGGVMPLTNAPWGNGECPLSATHKNIDGRTTRGHVDDYWIAVDNADSDPYITGGWAQHSYGDCTADYMGTNQSALGAADGSTWFWVKTSDHSRLYTDASYGQSEGKRDGCYGLRTFFESRGYVVEENFNQAIAGLDGVAAGFSLADFHKEIDAGNPILIHVEGHTMLAYGYQSGTSKIFIHDTWDHNDHDMTWGDSYSGMAHYGVSVIHLKGKCACSSGACCDGCNFQPASYTCRSSAGSCDVVEKCTGSGPDCPADEFQSASTVCRASDGACDNAENCTGSSAACPANSFVSGRECRPVAGPCDVPEQCSGSSAVCPADSYVAAGTECRGLAGICDKADFCTGASAACPEDSFLSSETVCRQSIGVCDVDEVCPGNSADCPQDLLRPADYVCREVADDCDVLEYCTGQDVLCPPNLFLDDTHECRAAVGDCDAAEFCTGFSEACPSDKYARGSKVCRPAVGTCDLDENCTGYSVDCPADEFRNEFYECRPMAGACDRAEVCTGIAGECPLDEFRPAGIECRPVSGLCDIAENCDGTSVACPHDVVRPEGFECRSSSGVCDKTEFCDGILAWCPTDGFQPAGLACDDSYPETIDDMCDEKGNCSGERDYGIGCSAGFAGSGAPSSSVPALLLIIATVVLMLGRRTRFATGRRLQER